MASVVSFIPLMRNTIGFDRFDDLFESMTGGTEERLDSYPPHNIEKIGDHGYRIVMAVAGFTPVNLEIMTEGESLIVSGKVDEKVGDESTYLYRGIATRAFQRSFRLEDHIKVTGAEMSDGLLTISLAREVSEKKKPRMIPITGLSVTKALEGKKRN